MERIKAGLFELYKGPGRDELGYVYTAWSNNQLPNLKATGLKFFVSSSESNNMGVSYYNFSAGTVGVSNKMDPENTYVTVKAF